MTKRKDDEYFEELKEWQEKQYVAGHYTGTNMSPGFKKIFKNKKVSITILVLILLSIILTFIKQMTNLFGN